MDVGGLKGGIKSIVENSKKGNVDGIIDSGLAVLGQLLGKAKG